MEIPWKAKKIITVNIADVMKETPNKKFFFKHMAINAAIPLFIPREDSPDVLLLYGQAQMKSISDESIVFELSTIEESFPKEAVKTNVTITIVSLDNDVPFPVQVNFLFFDNPPIVAIPS